MSQDRLTKLMENVERTRVLWHIGTKHDTVLNNCLKSLQKLPPLLIWTKSDKEL